MPFSRIALPRRIAASMSAGEWTRFSTPRALYITLKLSVLRQPLPQLQRELVEVRVGVEVVVRADDRRVAPGVAAAEPALLEHGDVGDAVLLREVVGGREPVPAAADDDDVVARLRRGLRHASGQRSWCDSALRAREKIEYFMEAQAVPALSLPRAIAYSNGRVARSSSPIASRSLRGPELGGRARSADGPRPTFCAGTASWPRGTSTRR